MTKYYKKGYMMQGNHIVNPHCQKNTGVAGLLVIKKDAHIGYKKLKS